MSLYRAQLRRAAMAALRNATAAGAQVFDRTDLPTTLDQLPAVFVQTPSESMQSQGRGRLPQFTVTTTLLVLARCAATSPDAAQEQAELLCAEITTALLFNVGLISLVQQVAGVETIFRLSGEGREHVAEALLNFSLEYQQVFQPTPNPAPLVEVGLEADFTGDGVPDVLAAATFEVLGTEQNMILTTEAGSNLLLDDPTPPAQP